MTKTCIICKKQPIPDDLTRSFHKFPINNEQKQKWMKIIGIADIKKISTVCSDHFKDNSYQQTDGYTKTRRLLSTAVPVLNKSSAVLKLITDNIMIPSSVEEASDKTRTVKMDKCFLNKSVQSSCNTNVSDLNIQYDASSCINETDVSQDVSFSELEGIEMTTNEKNSINCKRKRSITDVGRDIPKKKFCFMDGCQPSHVSREDFVSEEAWVRFMKLIMSKNKQITAGKKRSWRRGKQIYNFKELIKTLRDKNASSAAEYLEVVIQ